MHFPRWMLLPLIVGVTHAAAFAQAPDTTAHRVPFASTGNALELAVVNTARGRTARFLGAVSVSLVEAPEWLAVTPERVVLDGLEAGEEAVAGFAFAVDRGAPVGVPGEAVFAIRSGAGVLLATKAVQLEVEPPRAFALTPGYPNPFGGAVGAARTTLAYELPEAAKVELAVYDVLGRRIAVLADGEEEAGRHEVVWDARAVASGLYLVQLVAETAAGRRVSKVQRITRVR